MKNSTAFAMLAVGAAAVAIVLIVKRGGNTWGYGAPNSLAVPSTQQGAFAPRSDYFSALANQTDVDLSRRAASEYELAQASGNGRDTGGWTVG